MSALLFRIADTFTDSLGRLTGDEQKAVKTTAFDLQLDPSAPGHQFHRFDRARDKNFWSVRVSADVRLIVHRSNQSLLLCYVDHHDKAYAWAERRKLETHPTTGAAQLVEIRETVKEIVVPVYVNAELPLAPREPARVFAGSTDDELLEYGVPREWLADVKSATEESLLVLAEHLPAEAAEALLELATGGVPRTRAATPAPPTPFEHPDAQRRFRLMANAEELEQALAYPWDKWTIFLHPDQRELVARDFSGPARVAGSAGTGKTIVALHRTVHLAREHRDARVLLTTFSDALANALHVRLRRLIAAEPRLGERIDVHSLDAIATRMYRQHIGAISLVSASDLRSLIANAAGAVQNHSLRLPFLVAEWDQVVDAWQLDSWEAYRDVERLGRKTRLREPQRRAAWSIFEQVRGALVARGNVTRAEMYTRLATQLGGSSRVLFDHVVVDEAQDLNIAQLRFLAALGGNRPNALFFAGDLGQRIFQQPFSWKSLGVDVRGRSRTLRVNYRTSHQIRTYADRLLNPVLTDVDGNEEVRSGTISAFSGVAPTITVCASVEMEREATRRWIVARLADGIQPHEIGVFVRSEVELPRARAAVEAAGALYVVLDDRVATTSGKVALSSMHLAKGLEFRAVVVMACDDDVLPSQRRIEEVGDDADLSEVYETERQLLYVACTRARDHLLVTGVAPTSEFLGDLMA